MENKPTTKKPSLLGSFFDKARSFNISGFSKASSDLTSPTQQESPKFKRKSVIFTGTFGPTQFDQTPQRAANIHREDFSHATCSNKRYIEAGP